MNVYLVVLEHEHGIDISAYETMEGAFEGALGVMSSTLDELEDRSLQGLQELIKEGKAEAAIDLYNELYEENFEGDEVHNLFIRSAKVKN